MHTPTATDELRDASLFFMRSPKLWGLWPFLPLVRRCRGEMPEQGILYDAARDSEHMRLTSTVFIGNVFMLPQTLKQFLELPKLEFASLEEIVDAGWRVD